MTTVPTPADFLMSREPDEEYDEPAPLAPVEIALAALEARVFALEAGIYPEELPSRDELLVREDESAALLIDTSHELADLEAKHDVVLRLVAQIEGIVRKSTSKVSLEVKAAIEAWKNPTLPEQQKTAELVHAVPTGGRAPCGVHYTKGTFGTDPTCPSCVADQTPSPAPDGAQPAVDDAAGAGSPEQDVQQSAGEGLPQPAADAPVDEWRVYARYLGHGRTGPAFNELDSMNRSQIRTMLGIEQPVPTAGS